MKTYNITEEQIKEIHSDLAHSVSGNAKIEEWFPEVFEGPAKEMTISDIEKELGYKIKIV